MRINSADGRPVCSPQIC